MGEASKFTPKKGEQWASWQNFKGNLWEFQLFVKIFSEQRIFKILMDFLKNKRIFARGVQNFLEINEMPLC